MAKSFNLILTSFITTLLILLLNMDTLNAQSGYSSWTCNAEESNLTVLIDNNDDGTVDWIIFDGNGEVHSSGTQIGQYDGSDGYCTPFI